MVQGMAQMEIGCHTDVMDGCPKAVAIPMLLRSANPQIIAVDEITQAEDLLAMEEAAHCGHYPCGLSRRPAAEALAAQAAAYTDF